jgi:hypothetical protein
MAAYMTFSTSYCKICVYPIGRMALKPLMPIRIESEIKQELEKIL